MPNTNTDKACPNLDQYQQLALGGLSDVEKESLLSHLENCDDCAQKLKTLPEPDTLVGMLRQADTVNEETAKKAIAGLVERLSKLRPEQVPAGAKPQATAAGVAKADNTIDQPPTDAAKKATYDFLAPAQAADELGRLGPYRVLEVLGTGGMGVVFRAEDPQLARLVAVKAMLPGSMTSESARQRFLREARAAAAIKHDHIVSIYQVGEDRGVLYLAMELLDGEPLDGRLQREGKLPVAEVLRIGRQIALALAAAHKRGLIHRDIKPANIWLEADTNRVKILDFGLARTTGEQAQLTQQGAIVGTPAYMAPEQAKGKDVDHRCDLFSLGCVLYRMATGEALFRGADVVSTLVSVATETPRPPKVLQPTLPRALSDMIVNLLAKDAAGRPTSAQVVVEKLDHIAQELAKPALVKPRKWWPAFAAAAAMLLVLAGGIVYFMQTPDGTVRIEIDDPEIELSIKGHTATFTSKDQQPITLKPGKHGLTITRGDFVFDTASFELPKRGKTALKITWHPGQKIEVSQDGKVIAATSVDPDRRAAEWVLSIGGSIKIKENDQERQVGVAGDLPKGPFELTVVNLRNNAKVSDAGLANFKDCKNLTSLDLGFNKVSDAGLAHFKDCKNLTQLNLHNTQVSDAGLAVFKDCKNLTYLYLAGTQVGDAGLAHFKDHKNVTKLVLHHTPVSDAGLAHFKDYKDLTILDLHATQVGDAGLAHIKDCKNLTNLILAGTQVSDAGLERLAALAKLGFVNVTKTEVTEIGVKKLSAALPLCTIVSDHGTFGPAIAADPDRRAAEWVLSIGGSIKVTENGKERLTPELPAGPFELTGVILQGNPKVTDVGLAHFKDCKNLTSLDLAGTKVSDAGLVHLKDCKNLTNLALSGTQVSDAGLTHFKDCKNLTNLVLSSTKVRDAGLAYFKDYKNLWYLRLAYTQVNDAGLAHLKDCKNLGTLDLRFTQVTDAGLAHLKDCKNLTDFNLSGTQVSDAGLAHFKDCKNLLGLYLDGTKVSDAGLAHFKDCKSVITLTLAGTQVSDAGLERLSALAKLVSVNVTKTKVTEAGVKKLSATLPLCKIESDHGTFGPMPGKAVSPPAPSAELEALRREQIAPDALKMAGGGDPDRAPASLVGVLGEARPIHTGGVSSVAFSPDGRWLASGSQHDTGDSNIFVRDVATGQVQRIFKSPTQGVSAMAFSKDSRTLVAAYAVEGFQGIIKFWPMEKDAKPETLQPKLGSMWDMVVSADGRFLAAVGHTGGVNLWKWGQWDTPVEIIPDDQKDWVKLPFPFACLAFSPDGELLAVGLPQDKPENHPIRIYKTKDGNAVKRTFTGDSEKGRRAHSGITFSPDGKYLACHISGITSGVRVGVWEVASGKRIADFPGIPFGGTVAFSPDGKILAFGGDYRVDLYNMASQTKERVLSPSLRGGSVAFSPDGKFLVAGCDNGIMHMWDTTTWKEKGLERGHLHTVWGLALSPDGRTVLSAGNDGTLRQWDLARPEINQINHPFLADGRYASQNPPGSVSVAYRPDGSMFALVVRGPENVVLAWDAATLKKRWTVPLFLNSVAFSPDGKTFAGCVAPDGTVRLWDADSGTEIFRFPAIGQCAGIAFSGDGKLLAAASWDKNCVKVWDVVRGTELHSWQDTSMTAAVFRRDGQILAIGHKDGTISVWDLAEGKKKRTLTGHRAQVQSLKFTPDGKSIISSGHDGTIRLWNPEIERAQKVIAIGPANQRLVMDLDPSGRYVIAAGHGPVIYVLRLASGNQ